MFNQPITAQNSLVTDPPQGELLPQNLVGNLSQLTQGHLITTSIDEGVEVDLNEKDFENDLRSDFTAPCRLNPATETGLLPSNMFGDLSQINNIDSSDQSICTVSTGIGSPSNTSFDSNIESDLLSSLSSCAPSLTGGYTCNSNNNGNNMPTGTSTTSQVCIS